MAMARGFSRPVASIETDETDSIPSSPFAPDRSDGAGSGMGSEGDDNTMAENATATIIAAI